MIDEILKIGSFIISILPDERKNLQKITDDISASVRDESEIDKMYIMSKIRQIYNSEERIQKNELYRKTIGALIISYRESPPRQMPNATVQRIINKLCQLPDFQQTVNQQEDNNTHVKAGVKPAIKQLTKQGTRIHDYLIRFSETLEDDKPYKITELKSNFFRFLQEQSKQVKENGLGADIAYAIVNDRNRFHHKAENPKLDSIFGGNPNVKELLFYFPDENDRKTIKKFSLKIKDNPTIYWREGNERKETKLSELKSCMNFSD